MNTIETIEKLKIYLNGRINSLALNNPLISFTKPVILRAINNNIYKAEGFLSLIADESGNIDIQSLIPEMIQSVSTTKPFILHTEFLGDLEIGGGMIKMNIPFTNNQIVLGKTDLDVLKELFTENNSSYE
jgi:hypothetical protein